MGEDGRYVYAVKEFPKSEAGVRTVVVPDDYAWLCAKIRMLNPFGEYVFTDNNGKRITALLWNKWGIQILPVPRTIITGTAGA